MGSAADLAGDPAARVALLERLRERLELAGRLTLEMRDGLRRADAEAIDAATARLETLALEFKLLDAEYRRLPEVLAAPGPVEALDEASRRLQEASTRLARSAAVGGGLLERLVGMSRRLADAVQGAGSGTYRADGTSSEVPFEGLRLREKA